MSCFLKSFSSRWYSLSFSLTPPCSSPVSIARHRTSRMNAGTWAELRLVIRYCHYKHSTNNAGTWAEVRLFIRYRHYKHITNQCWYMGRGTPLHSLSSLQTPHLINAGTWAEVRLVIRYCHYKHITNKCWYMGRGTPRHSLVSLLTPHLTHAAQGYPHQQTGQLYSLCPKSRILTRRPVPGGCVYPFAGVSCAGLLCPLCAGSAFCPTHPPTICQQNADTTPQDGPMIVSVNAHSCL